MLIKKNTLTSTTRRKWGQDQDTASKLDCRLDFSATSKGKFHKPHAAALATRTASSPLEQMTLPSMQ
jgi:hypothetical protein